MLIFEKKIDLTQISHMHCFVFFNFSQRTFLPSKPNNGEEYEKHFSQRTFLI